MKIAVIGGGSWGGALALVAHRASHEVVIYSRDNNVCEEINKSKTNSRYLPGITFPSDIKAHADLSMVIDSDIILLAVPAQSIRQLSNALKKINISSKKTIIICAKGIEQKSFKLMSEVVREILPDNPVAVLSGPNFALEIAKDLPAVSSIASEDYNFAVTLAEYLSSNHFRIYPSDDIIAVQIIGAAKNVLAIATGVVIGKEYGENAKAAIISRGISEITNLLLAKGGRVDALVTPAGFGDVLLTCNSPTSRNTSYGIALGRDEAKDGAVLVEGFYSAESLYMLAKSLDVKMPICQSVYKIIHQNISLDKVIQELLERPLNIKAINLRK